MPSQFERGLIVVKFGSDLVADGSGAKASDIRKYAAGLAGLHMQSDLMVVTSGAVAAGRARVSCVQELENNPENYSLPVLASLGSIAIMGAWQEAFGEHNIMAGSVLVTHHEMGEGLEGGALTATLKAAFDSRVVPIVNENDTLSDIELMKLLTGGDNDGLAARLAHFMGAKGLRIYSANGGLYDNSKQLIPLVNSENIEHVRAMLEERSLTAVSGNGRGGMLSKINAAYAFAVGGGVAGRYAEIMQPNADMSGVLVTRVES